MFGPSRLAAFALALVAVLAVGEARAGDVEDARAAALRDHPVLVEAIAELEAAQRAYDAAVESRGYENAQAESATRQAKSEAMEKIAGRFDAAFVASDWATWKPDGAPALAAMRDGLLRLADDYQTEVDTAGAALLRLAELSPGDAALAGDAQYGVVGRHLYRGDTDAAEALATKLRPTLSGGWETAKFQLLRADLLAYRGDVDAARKVIDAVLASPPKDAPETPATDGFDIAKDVREGAAVRKRWLGRTFSDPKSLAWHSHAGGRTRLVTKGRPSVIVFTSLDRATYLRTFCRSARNYPSGVDVAIVVRYKPREKLWFDAEVKSLDEFKEQWVDRKVLTTSRELPVAWARADDLAKADLGGEMAWIVTDATGKVVFVQGGESLDSFADLAVRKLLR